MKVADRNTHWFSMIAPASQWYRGGTLRHCLANVTIAPASNTPKPNKWLNSSPTPFIVQWKRFFASNSELRFEVRTVRCWMSLHVNCGLQRKIALHDYSLSSSTRLFAFKITLLPMLMRRHRPPPERQRWFPNALSYTCHTNLWWPHRCLGLWHHCWTYLPALSCSSRHNVHSGHRWWRC